MSTLVRARDAVVEFVLLSESVTFVGDVVQLLVDECRTFAYFVDRSNWSRVA